MPLSRKVQDVTKEQIYVCVISRHGIALPDFYIVSSIFYKISKQARVPTFVWLFRDDATIAKGPGCDEGTNLRLRDFAVDPLIPTRVLETTTIYEKQ